MAAGAERPQGAAHDRWPARRYGARQATDHTARPPDVPVGLRRSDVRRRLLSAAEGDDGGPAAACHLAIPGHGGRAHAAPGQPPARTSTRGAVALSHGRRDPRLSLIHIPEPT